MPAVVLGLVLSFAALLLSPAPTSPNGVVISELRTRGPAGGNDEFVEHFNTPTNDVDISGYRLQGCATSGGAASNRATVPAGTLLEPGDHYLFTNSASGGHSGTVPGDQSYATGFTDFAAGTNQSGARLVDAPGAVIDSVGSPGSPCRERTGITTPAAHFDNDYFEREDPTDGHHVSDHDPPVLTLSRGGSR